MLYIFRLLAMMPALSVGVAMLIIALFSLDIKVLLFLLPGMVVGFINLLTQGEEWARSWFEHYTAWRAH